jgi:hypothetical protein
MAQLYNYRKLFSVVVHHRYYQSSRSSDLVFGPTGECRRILARHNLVFRPSPYGFQVFGDTGQDGKLKKKIEEDLALTFLIRCNHPHFDNFTELPLGQSVRQAYYFSNAVPNPVNVFGQGALVPLINKGSHAGSDDLMVVVAGAYQYTVPGTGNKTFTLVHERTGLTVDSQVAEASDGRFSYQFPMHDVPPGCYQLKIGGNVADRFLYQPEKHGHKVFGVAEIFTDVPPENNFLIDGGGVTVRDYGIAFLNRSTFWRYRAHNRSGLSLPNPGIAVGDDNSLFTHAGGLVFVSDNPMGLKEDPVRDIRLLKNISNLSSTALGNLANPGREQILPEKVNGSIKIFSDIFIYL